MEKLELFARAALTMRGSLRSPCVELQVEASYFHSCVHHTAF